MIDEFTEAETAEEILERIETYARRARVVCGGKKILSLMDLNESEFDQYIESLELISNAYDKLKRLYGEHELWRIDKLAERLDKEFGW